MTRDELEAEIWRHWPTRGATATAAVDAILAAADAYALAAYGVTADRRAVLDSATRPPGRARDGGRARDQRARLSRPVAAAGFGQVTWRFITHRHTQLGHDQDHLV